jgi:23S rRNA pseudouridine2605 synthase
MEKIRLNRFLSLCGVSSRRSADTLIAAGRARINGQPAAALGALVDPSRDMVTVDGRAVALPRRFRCVAFHKPAGYLCSRNDPHGRPVIYDILPPECRGLKYVGRLDADSEGLLLLTDDGGLIERLAHPRFLIGRTYRAWVSGAVSPTELRPLAHGIEFMGERYQPARTRIIARDTDATLLEFRITEGKKREVRQLCRAIGHQVLRLQRTAFGPIVLGNLPAGRVRELTTDELLRLGAS